ncbi:MULTISPECIES: dicarboxylate/amino acid:cation symporter [unclassified Pseudonocardia]|uniref:dicarboxylate/amino acid:cation symporter n=1 Tax=unclassified Pseudonocardia TaxID=2619320 RepID=UPI0001FFEA2A|nr:MULTISPECIES: dicarboxylate/amino acid:cation symporter [unclassified Pseudonocardia]ALE73105.1 sodium:proton antiporter [Pseudonocardia sp. EC080625-04]ALL76424.1 sodium:proton antiporter [Pseudonocardia sp. EC080610-09]ALL83451.1 sodium:proton antiporter [Pseudonocardia sp. EC080619-01]OLM19277.1 sodium:dicarboxylate symporter [Pseudonocardia sp. Ae707_Ps1]
MSLVVRAARAWRRPRVFAVLTLAGLVLGALLGLTARLTGADWLASTLDTVGSLFTGLLQFTVVPLVFLAVVVGIVSLRDLGGGRTAARLGGRTVAWFAGTSLIAVLIGLAIGIVGRPGAGISVAADPEAVQEVGEKTVGSWQALLTGIIPANPVAAFAEDNVLQVVLAALLVGAAAYALGEKAEPFVAFSRSAFEIVLTIIGWIIVLAPVGVLGLIGNAFATYGSGFVGSLLGLIVTVYLGCAIVLFGVYPLLLRVVAGIGPRRFFSVTWPVLQFAFVSRSSGASLPQSRQAAIDLGVDRNYAGFAVPLATTTKMDGCAAVYPALATIFIAHISGIELAVWQYLVIVAVAVFGALATAGTTGWFTMLTLTLAAVGLPPEVIAAGIAVVIGIDPILDMMRTATNVAGQITVPTVVAAQEGILGRDDAAADAGGGVPDAGDEASESRDGTPATGDGQQATGDDDRTGAPARAGSAGA